jgi:hypothetical protein
MKQVMTPPVRKLILRGHKLEKVVGGRNYVCTDVHIQRCQQNREKRDHYSNGQMEPAE